MEHRGEILQNAIRQSGFSVTRLAKKLHHSRRWMYHVFENPDVSIELIAEIGRIIQHDFSDEIRGFKKYAVHETSAQANEPNHRYNDYKKELDLLKDKYVKLLEKYNALLAEQAHPKKRKK
jgi:predicted transcriptional regulator